MFTAPEKTCGFFFHARVCQYVCTRVHACVCVCMCVCGCEKRLALVSMVDISVTKKGYMSLGPRFIASQVLCLQLLCNFFLQLCCNFYATFLATFFCNFPPPLFCQNNCNLFFLATFLATCFATFCNFLLPKKKLLKVARKVAQKLRKVATKVSNVAHTKSCNKLAKSCKKKLHKSCKHIEPGTQ